MGEGFVGEGRVQKTSVAQRDMELLGKLPELFEPGFLDGVRRGRRKPVAPFLRD
jgi:hypothetical protein